MSSQTLPGRTAAPTPSSTLAASRAADVAAFSAGAIAGLVALAIGELAAGIIAGAPSLVVAIADLIVALQPPGAKQLAVDLFGDADKAVVDATIVAGALVIAGLLGIVGRRSFRAAAAGFLVAGLVALGAALRQPLTDSAMAVVTVAVAVAASLAALRAMLAATGPRWAVEGVSAASITDWDRRRFLVRSGALAAASVAVAGFGRSLIGGRAAAPVTATPVPELDAPTPALPPGAELDVEGITPIVVPNDRFYRIDTAFAVPRVDASTWSLRVAGMVEREVTLTYDELLGMPLFDQHVTIACVSNEVGGRYVGNALWRGVDLRGVLALAGVKPEATQVVGRSVDGWTAGFPTAWAMDPDRRPIIALGMNGEPLPADHGYPARLIIPGLYGYVSATKWLKEIELTTLDAFDAYWVPLGWAKEAPILTQSRIDVPRGGSQLASGPVAIAGVAWAPDRGVSAVEVRIDDGEWQHAQLSEPLAPAAWVQWTLTWEATPGDHRIAVRATDGEGVVQTDERTRPAPDGARGHHGIGVTVA